MLCVSQIVHAVVSKTIANVVLLHPTETLDLRGNSLTSTLPEGIFQIASLSNLYLADNALSGNISASFELLTNIRRYRLGPIVYLSRNSEYSHSPTLFVGRVELTGNNLIGEIPAGLCALKTDPGDLAYLTADCDEVICACCDNDCAV